MKKWLCLLLGVLLLAIVLLAGTITGCSRLSSNDSSNPASEATDSEQEDMNQIFKSLLIKSVELNLAVADEFAWDFAGNSPILKKGSTITIDGDTYILESDYCILKDPTRLHALGIYSLADLRTKTEEIYTTVCAEKTRYYTVPDEAVALDSPACIEYEGALYRKGITWLINCSYAFNTIQLIEKADNSVTFEISCIDWQGNQSEKPLTFIMVKTAQGWRLDNCYTNVTLGAED